MKVPFVDLKRQYEEITPQVRKAIERVLKSGKFVLGEEVSTFERDFASFCGTRYCVGVGSGTDALILSLKALGVGQGDEVILPANTFASAASAVIHVGAKPVLLDIDSQYLLINTSEVEDKITKKTRTIIPVHIHGKPYDVNQIAKIAKKYNLKVIEDAAQAVGSRYRGKRTGAFGDASVFSFYPSKNLGAYGDGGAVITNSRKVADKVSMLRNQGRSRGTYKIVGYNSLLDSIQAAILLVKLKYLVKWNKLREKNSRLYTNALKDLDLSLPNILPYTKSNWQYFVIRVKKRDNLKKFLLQKGVRCGIHYPEPIHLLPAFKHLGYKKGDFPVAEKASREMLSLPMFPQLTDSEIEFVTESIRKFLK